MKRCSLGITLSSVLIFIFLYVPMLCVVIFSFNASKMGLTWGGFSTHWYEKLIHNEMILHAAWNTLVLAVASTAVSTIFGTLLAIGMYRFPWSRKAFGKLNLLLHMPVVTPDIIFAVALVIAFSVIRYLTGFFELGMGSMIVGHITFQTSFVALAVKGRMELIGSDVEEAACDLYAGYWRVLTKVLLPMLTPGIIAGAMLAFTLSLDDFVISFFTAGPKSTTLPLFIYASVKRGITPEIHALSSIIMLVTIIAVALMQKIAPETK